jgi:hypothetical protein
MPSPSRSRPATAVPSPDQEVHAVRSTTAGPAPSPTRRRRSPHRRIAVATLAAMLLCVSLASVASGALAPQPGQRIDLRVLLIGATGTEPTFGGWKAALTREGVPFDAKVADAAAPFTDATFADYASGHAKYQAVILATGDLVHQVANPGGTVSFPSALADSEWTALAKFEQTFGIRQISDATFPSPVHGLNGPTNTGEQGGNAAALTAAGLQLFPYLKGPVPIDNPSATAVDAFGYQATPAPQVAPAAFGTLLAGPNGSSYVGIYTHPDGREEMVATVDSNENQLHAQILRHGMLSWVTRGVYLGYQRNYYEMQVDDVFLPDARWSTTLKRSLVDGPTTAPDETQCAPALNTPDEFIGGGGVAITPPPLGPAPAGLPACNPIRMTAADVARLVAWQNANGIRLDMVFNGSGSAEFLEDTGLPSDPLLAAFMASKNSFHWINHTFTHLQLDPLTQAQLLAEIGDNISWGLQQGLPMDREELVTGEHSGLHNAAMPATLDALGVKWIAADNSREPTPYGIGGAVTVPRYPSNVYYNVETQAEQLDEYNYIYLPPPAGKCVSSATNTCRTAPATWAEYVDSEAGIMFRHVMGNDPRPHFAHQSNVAGDGVLYTVVDELLRRYRLYFGAPLVQLTHKEIGQTIARQAGWAQNLAAGRVSGYLQDGLVHVTTTTTMPVPVTGTPQGDLYGGERSGWFTVAPGQPLVQQAPGAATVRRRAGAVAAQRAQRTKAAQAKKLRMTRVRMTPRRFAVSHSRRSVKRRRSHATDGTTVTWVLNQRASVRITVRKLRPGGRTTMVRSFTRKGITGENTARYSGRVGRRLLKPGRYRMTITAATKDQRTAPRRLAFTVVRG